MANVGHFPTRPASFKKTKKPDFGPSKLSVMSSSEPESPKTRRYHSGRETPASVGTNFLTIKKNQEYVIEKTEIELIAKKVEE